MTKQLLPDIPTSAKAPTRLTGHRGPLRRLQNAILAAAVAGFGFAAAARPPNVIIIFTDDQGSVDANCYGAHDLQTPAIDRIAADGVRFTQFYAGSAVCSPSRVALLTGRYPLRAGLDGNASSPPLHGLDDDRAGVGLPANQVTIAQSFKVAGYATAHIGKWHLGYKRGQRPNDRGFDESFGFMDGCIDNYSHFFYWNGPNRHDLWHNGKEVFYPGVFFGDLMLTNATKFMEAHRQQPFFIYYAINNPHYPYQGHPRWLEYYKNLPFPRNLYAAFISTLDEHIGRLLDEVDKLGLRNETIIAFQSDQGHSTEQRAFGGGGSSGPYRGAKFSLFEGGIRIPAIIAWPGHLPRGEVRDQVAHGCDWLPTLAELCGVKLLQPDIDGRSLVNIIRSADAPSPHNVLHWTMGKQWAVLEGNWKLIHGVRPTGNGPPLTAADREFFLSDLAHNVGETHNYAVEHSDVVKRLEQLHQTWFKELNVP